MNFKDLQKLIKLTGYRAKLDAKANEFVWTLFLNGVNALSRNYRHRENSQANRAVLLFY